MGRIIEKKELLEMNNEKLLKLVKNKGVLLYLYNGKINQGRVKDITAIEGTTPRILFDTGQDTFKSNIKKIEIMDDDLAKIITH